MSVPLAVLADVSVRECHTQSPIVRAQADSNQLYGWGREISNTPRKLADNVKLAVAYAFGANMFRQFAGTQHIAYVTRKS
jgi:hypothetical protein